MSPYKNPKLPVYIFTLLGIAAGILNLVTTPLSVTSVTMSLVAIFFCYQLGKEASKFLGTMFHRPVNKQVFISTLSIKQTYYLNGQTPCIFLGWDEDSGQAIFHIKGVDDPNHLDQGSLVLPWRAREYFSETQEIPEI